jgi:hypothetical protein
MEVWLDLHGKRALVVLFSTSRILCKDDLREDDPLVVECDSGDESLDDTTIRRAWIHPS